MELQGDWRTVILGYRSELSRKEPPEVGVLHPVLLLSINTLVLEAKFVLDQAEHYVETEVSPNVQNLSRKK